MAGDYWIQFNNVAVSGRRQSGMRKEAGTSKHEKQTPVDPHVMQGRSVQGGLTATFFSLDSLAQAKCSDRYILSVISRLGYFNFWTSAPELLMLSTTRMLRLL